MNSTEKICKELNLKQTAKFLKKHDNYIILTHASPDGDTLGSAYALYYALNEIGKAACVLCPDVIPQKYDYFARQTNYIYRYIILEWILNILFYFKIIFKNINIYIFKINGEYYY